MNENSGIVQGPLMAAGDDPPRTTGPEPDGHRQTASSTGSILRELFSRVCHWGPLLALSIIKVVTWATIDSLSFWLPPSDSSIGLINYIIFLVLVAATLYNFATAMLVGPGVVPVRWRPADRRDEQFLQYCLICQSFKVPRSHHCRKCGRCVLKMDHHCPWYDSLYIPKDIFCSPFFML